ncbi:MAG: hypothetical protein AAF224_13705 [Pseudomonadota bacterium]
MATPSIIAVLFAGAAMVATPSLAQSQQTDASPQESSGTQAPINDATSDNVADDLNARQQLEQTVTFTRTINGAVVSTDKRTIEFDENAPTGMSEGRLSPIKTAADNYDAETLTRNEALDEARLDFSLADLNRDGSLSIDEFSAYVLTPTAASTDGAAQNTNDARRDQVNEANSRTEQFLAALDAELASETRAETAELLFNDFIGEADAIERARNPKIRKPSKDDVRRIDARLFGVAYMKGFDRLDANEDGLLSGSELTDFRRHRNGFTALARDAARARETQSSDTQ